MKEPTELAVAPRRQPDDRLPERTGDGRGSARRIVLAQPVSGVVGGSRRMTHVFVTVTGPSSRLTALCGQRFEFGTVEFLDTVAGMPCERCLFVAVSRWQCNSSSPNHT